MYHIYALNDPHTSETRYVGLSKNAYKRYAHHVIISAQLVSEKDNWIQGLLKMGTGPLLEILETVETRKEAEARETYWIKHFLKVQTPLLNISKNIAVVPRSSKHHGSFDSKEEEIRQILKTQGWNLFKRRRGRRQYLYAQKWKEGEVYITSENNLRNFNPKDVLDKIPAS